MKPWPRRGFVVCGDGIARSASEEWWVGSFVGPDVKAPIPCQKILGRGFEIKAPILLQKNTGSGLFHFERLKMPEPSFLDLPEAQVGEARVMLRETRARASMRRWKC